MQKEGSGTNPLLTAPPHPNSFPPKQNQPAAPQTVTLEVTLTERGNHLTDWSGKICRSQALSGMEKFCSKAVQRQTESESPATTAWSCHSDQAPWALLAKPDLLSCCHLRADKLISQAAGREKTEVELMGITSFASLPTPRAAAAGQGQHCPCSASACSN